MIIQKYDSWKLATPEEASSGVRPAVIYWCWNCDSEIHEDDKYYDIKIKNRIYPFCEDCIDDCVSYA